MLRSSVVALLCACLLASCGGSKKPIVVGSKDETEQILLGEIVAQHLEHRLGRSVERRAGLGGTAVLYQSLISGDVGIYPEYTGLIESEILKEPANPDPQILLTRVRSQMDMAQIAVLDPLGFDNPPALVVSAAGSEKLANLSNAARANRRWKPGWSYDFQSRSDGLAALAPYHLSFDPPRILQAKQLFPALEKGDVDMIALRATDGHLASPDWTILADDRKVFPAYQACLLARKDLLAAEPALRPALAELSGKIQADTMRKLNAEVDRDHRPVAAVASDFLAQAGLR